MYVCTCINYVYIHIYLFDRIYVDICMYVSLYFSISLGKKLFEILQFHNFYIYRSFTQTDMYIDMYGCVKVYICIYLYISCIHTYMTNILEGNSIYKNNVSTP